MLYVIISDDRSFRKERLGEILETAPDGEIIAFDDTAMEAADLEQYLYPSLFSPAAPIVHARFMAYDELSSEAVKRLVASPTIFIFEEFLMSAPQLAVFKKAGAILHGPQKQKAQKKESDIFAAALALTATDKKSRWLAYRAALEKHPIEAILGILYWKIRTLAERDKAGGPYAALYRSLLDAHARAWQSGAPLEVVIEKVILTQ